MLEILSDSHEPGYNLAAEQYILEEIEYDGPMFMLWQNRPSVVVGRHQNTADEVDLSYAKEKNIPVVRRMTGGGAVYHDMGNLNFTLVLNRSEVGDPYDFSHLMEPILEALECFGIKGERSGRNDITAGGKKVVGSASRVTADKVLYHACILIDTNLDELQRILTVSKDKLAGKGVASVRSRVAVLSEFGKDISVVQMSRFLREVLEASYGNRKLKRFSDFEISQIEVLKAARYDLDAWNIGASPKYEHRFAARFPWGGVQLMLMLKDGKIAECSVYGDYFSDEPADQFNVKLRGVSFTRQAVAERLAELDIARFFRGAAVENLVDLMFPASN